MINQTTAAPSARRPLDEDQPPLGTAKTRGPIRPRNFSAGKSGFGLRLFRLRFHVLKLTQRQFAERFGLSYGMVRDLEQGRAQPTRSVTLYVSAVETFPELMMLVAKREQRV